MFQRAATVIGTGRELGPRALLPWRFGGGLQEERSDVEHLVAALSWLRRAQEVCRGRGVSAMYRLGIGWADAYPETSGYLIATLLAHARTSGEPDARSRALQLGDWELAILTPSGGVLSSPGHPQTRVFNTGQVILGLCALAEEVGEGQGSYLQGAERAGRYLLAHQEEDGRWDRDTYCGARTYHARVD
ncbi:MAG TPA: hypothetical protein VMK12_09350, partial [Anaeromyxobacteraceae bacterium]|nr:hypothetical protein [Anaeromyxobacteraceae bacterium]